MPADRYESFFDELEKISKFSPLATPKAGALQGAAALGGYAALKGVSGEAKSRAKDQQAHLSPEEQKRNRRLRTTGNAIETGLSASLGAGLGAGMGKLNRWGSSGNMAKDVHRGVGRLVWAQLQRAKRATRSTIESNLPHVQEVVSKGVEEGVKRGVDSSKPVRAASRVAEALGKLKSKLRFKK